MMDKKKLVLIFIVVFLININLVSSEYNCGLRGFDGSEVEIFACEISQNDDSPLKIVSNNVQYDILLVDPSARTASDFRILTEEGVRALKRYNFASCGNNVIDFGEECDNGEDNNNSGNCTEQCFNATCGDGFIWDGVEECDDGNLIDGDGCDENCTIEEGCEFGTASCEFNGFCNQDLNCEWLIPPTNGNFINVLNYGRLMINYDIHIPPLAAIGHSAISTEGTYPDNNNDFSYTYIGHSERETGASKTREYYATFNNLNPGNNLENLATLTGEDKNSGLVSVNNNLKYYGPGGQELPEFGETVGPLMVFQRDEPTQSLEITCDLTTLASPGLFKPSETICEDCGSSVGSGYELVAAGSAVASGTNPDSGLITNQIFVPVYLHSADQRIVGIYNSYIDDPILGSYSNWELLLPNDLKDSSYTYDYPTIAADGPMVVIMGVRYPINDLDGIEWYAYYTVNGGETWDFETKIFYDSENPGFYLGPIYSRSNTAVFDSEGVVHYSAGISPFGYREDDDNNEDLLIPVDAIYGSTPSEILFDVTATNNKFSYRPVFPNPGKNSKKYSEDNRTIAYESLVPNLNAISTHNIQSDESQGFYGLYEQQAINKENEWMAQIWMGWDMIQTGINNYYYCSGERNLRMVLSNDNGKHWTPPINILSYNMMKDPESTAGIGKDFKYPTISKDIFDLGNEKGLITIIYTEDDLPQGSATQANRGYLRLEVDFGELSLTENKYLIFSGNNWGPIFRQLGGGWTIDTLKTAAYGGYIDDVYTVFDHSGVSSNSPYLGSGLNFQGSVFISRPESRGNIDFFNPPPSGSNSGQQSTGSLIITCFDGDSLVSTTEGQKKIKDIQIGDYVYSLGEDNKLVKTRVNQLLVHDIKSVSPFIKIDLSNNKIIKTTDDHGFYDPEDNSYKAISNFKVGNNLYQYNEEMLKFEKVKITSIKKIKSPEKTYNLALNSPNNYLVEGVVVHNTIKTLPFIPPINGGLYDPDASSFSGGGGGSICVIATTTYFDEILSMEINCW